VTIVDEHLDVLQNIEFAILQVYRKNVGLRDTQVMRSLDALIDLYRAESRGHTPKDFSLPEQETLVFESVRDVCEIRRGRQPEKMATPTLSEQDKTAEDILMCLRKVRRSVERWNRRGGKQGYLEFVSQFVR